MNVKKIINNLNVRPTDRKMKKAKAFVDSVLPKEMPLEKEIRFLSKADSFERIKDSIQVSIDNMTRG